MGCSNFVYLYFKSTIRQNPGTGRLDSYYLGILAYWLVNTIRHQLKAKHINSNWSELVRIGIAQKVITTTAQNTFDKKVSIRKCSVPNNNLQQILDILQLKY